MHTFSIWAPRAEAVSVQVDESIAPLKKKARGWWTVESQARHGSNYAFSINGQRESYPDPRSLWQPHGVHGTSRVYDHARYVWSDHGWNPPQLSRGIVYELHIGTFTSEGSFDAAVSRLDYLVYLGITHVELMPVASFAGSRGWGYDGVLLFCTYEGYGGPDGLKRFVDACHERGLAVLLDVVYNHFGPTGNYAGQFGPYLTDSHSTPWGGAVNLEEAGSDEVRRFYCDNAKSWLRDFHIDGLRLDAVHSLVDRSAVHFLEQLSVEISVLSKEIKRNLVLIAESDLNDPRIVTSRGNNGIGLDAQWNDDFHHALFTVLHREEHGYYEDYGNLAKLSKALMSTFVYDGIYSVYRGRTHGRPVTNVSQSRFLGYIQNHDQIGNRALGDRLYPLISLSKALVAAAIVLTAPFIPMIFQGEEFGSSNPFQYFADHDDPAMARAVSMGRRREFEAFGWSPEIIPDPEELDTFTNSKLNWDEIDTIPHERFLRWYRNLITLRKSEPYLYDPDLSETRCDYSDTQGWLVTDRGPISIFSNFGAEERAFNLEVAAVILISSSQHVRYSNQTLFMPAESIVVLRSGESHLLWTAT